MPQNNVIDMAESEVIRHLMIMNFNENSGKIIAKKIASFSFNGTELLKTLFMEGQHYVFRYSDGASQAFIHRFNENEIELIMQVPVAEPFNIYGGLFVVGSGQYGLDHEQAIFACGTKSDSNRCFYIVNGNFKRTKPKPSFNYNFGQVILKNGLQAMTTLDGCFVN